MDVRPSPSEYLLGALRKCPGMLGELYTDDEFHD
jgi:hypothetical protein